MREVFDWSVCDRLLGASVCGICADICDGICRKETLFPLASFRNVIRRMVIVEDDEHLAKISGCITFLGTNGGCSVDFCREFECKCRVLLEMASTEKKVRINKEKKSNQTCLDTNRCLLLM